MNQVRSRLPILGAIAIAAALTWGSGVVTPGSRFSQSRPTYDQ